MIFSSEKMIYNGERYIAPACVLDTAERTITVVDSKTFESKTIAFHTDYVKDHLSYVSEHHPERLQKLVNEGRIIEYLNDIEEKAIMAVDRQVEKWKKSDKEYQAALLAGDELKAVGLENGLKQMAEEIVRDTIVNV